MLHPLVLCNLAFEPDLVGALVELLDPSVLKFSLSAGDRGEEERHREGMNRPVVL